MSIIEIIKYEAIKRSNSFEEQTKGSYINNEDIILNKALEFEISIL